MMSGIVSFAEIEKLINELKESFNETIDGVVKSINESFEKLKSDVEDLRKRVEDLEKTVVKVEAFSDDEAKAIGEAFTDVNRYLGYALAELGKSGFGAETVFDAKKGVLSVKLYKYSTLAGKQ
jgi:predicted nuclease with TOPRIM domain